MVLPQEEEASSSSSHRRPANNNNVNVEAYRRHAEDEAVAAAAAARWQHEQYENAARRALFPDPNAPIGSQGDLSYQNEVNLLLEAAEERAKKYWNMMDYDWVMMESDGGMLDTDFFYSMPGDPMNGKWQSEGMLPPSELQAPDPAEQHHQLGPRPFL